MNLFVVFNKEKTKDGNILNFLNVMQDPLTDRNRFSKRDFFVDMRSSVQSRNLAVFTEDYIRLMRAVSNDKRLMDLETWTMPLKTFYRSYNHSKKMKVIFVDACPADIHKVRDEIIRRVTADVPWTSYSIETYLLGRYELKELQQETIINQSQENQIMSENNNAIEPEKKSKLSGIIKYKIADMLLKKKGKMPLAQVAVLESFSKTGHLDLEKIIAAGYQEKMLKRIEKSDGNLDIEELAFLEMAETGEISTEKIMEARLAKSLVDLNGEDDEEETKEEAVQAETETQQKLVISKSRRK